MARPEDLDAAAAAGIITAEQARQLATFIAARTETTEASPPPSAEAAPAALGPQDEVPIYDNLDALRFYQRRGLRLTRVDPGAVERSRSALKPGIPEVGFYGIPIRDELELELTAEGSD